MKKDKRQFLGFILIFFLTEAFGQKADIKLLTPNISGSTGLFTLPVAETLRQGEFAVGFHSYRFNRDPGVLAFTHFPLSFSIGLHDRIEFFGSFEVHKRVEAKDVLVDKISPGSALLPAVVGSAGQMGYFNDSPFIDVSSGDGKGDLRAGAKFNLLSERDVGCLSLALQPMIRFPSESDRSNRLRGLTAGVWDAGLDAIASKRFGKRAVLSGKLGLFSGRNVDGVQRQHQLDWGVGMEWPVIQRSMRVIGELVGEAFLGEKPSGLVNVVSPLDSNVGFRIRLLSWCTFSAALNLHWKSSSGKHPEVLSSGRFGWVFQASIHRKINRPPRIECGASRSEVTEGERVTISARLSDPDDDALWLSWRSNGGHLTEKGRSVILDTSGMDPGRYSVMAEAGDDKNVASCSVDIEIWRRE